MLVCTTTANEIQVSALFGEMECCPDYRYLGGYGYQLGSKFVSGYNYRNEIRGQYLSIELDRAAEGDAPITVRLYVDKLD